MERLITWGDWTKKNKRDRVRESERNRMNYLKKKKQKESENGWWCRILR